MERFELYLSLFARIYGEIKLRSEEFREQANQCEEVPNRTDDPAVKRQYLELAQRSRELAEQAENSGLF